LSGGNIARERGEGTGERREEGRGERREERLLVKTFKI
jgi:hypothetical protein